MYAPYGPYINCTDGALDYVDKLLDWASKYDLTVLIDIHGLKDSQNGFDNSGQALGFEWTSLLNNWPQGLDTFEHWPIRSAKWMGIFDRYSGEYTSINYDNIQHALDVVETVVLTHKDHPAVLGLEPVNEPWQYTPIEHLKRFYWEAYLIVKKHAPLWKYVIHDSFRFDTSIWGGFMAGCPDRALDTHIYQAWNLPASTAQFNINACQMKKAIFDMEIAFGPVIVGEWSLATDNCAMWLNGFNDNLSGYPMLPCKYVPCPEPYMGSDQPGTPVDPGKPIQGPFGTGMSGPSYGMCPIGRDWMVEDSDGMNWQRNDPTAPEGFDGTDDVMKDLALKKINTFTILGHGFYFWNFRTELPEPRWSYLLAVQKGWIPSGNSLNTDEVTNACEKEDKGQYQCVAKRGQLRDNVIMQIKVCLSRDPTLGLGSNIALYEALDDEGLNKAADTVFKDFWAKYRLEGFTCDFGGVAQLMELEYTYVPRSQAASRRKRIALTKRQLLLVVLVSCMALIPLFMVFGKYMERRGANLREATLRNLGAFRQSFARFSYARLGEASEQPK
jgi:glucan 1,3-beta-glucosidase